MAKQRHTHRRRAAAGWWALALICWLATPAAGQVEAKDTTGGSGADARYGTGPRFNGNLTAWVYSHLRYPEEAKEQPDTLRTAPHATPVRRLDDVKAVKEPRFTYFDYEQP